MFRRRYIILGIVLSLLLHLLVGLLSLIKLPQGNPKPPEEVEVTLSKHPYQIADIAPPKKEERPDDAKFLGMYDSKVPQELVAPTRKPSAGSSASKLDSSQGHKEDKKGENEGEGMKLASKTPEESRDVRLRPTPPSEPEDYLNGPTEDFYPDYKMGDHTYLNVLRYPKIGYFVRLKKIFKTTFNPIPALRTYYYANQISKGQVEVVLGVVVDPSGKLESLSVIRSSGLDLYDREAMRTIRESAPFAAPPNEILDQTSRLRMAWTFTVYL